MNTVNVPVDELIGEALDCAVAIALDGEVRNYPHIDGTPHWEACGPVVIQSQNFRHRLGWIGEQHPAWPGDTKWRPSSNWAQGGPILYDNAISVKPLTDATWIAEDYITHASAIATDDEKQNGYLVAAMRVFVKQQLGDTVTIPKEFVK